VVLAADFGTGQVLASLLWLALFVILAGLFVTMFADIVRSDDLSGPTKALWTLAILVLPLVGTLAYLTMRGDSMQQRLVRAGRSAPTDALHGSLENERFRLSALHEAGSITDAELAAATARLHD